VLLLTCTRPSWWAHRGSICAKALLAAEGIFSRHVRALKGLRLASCGARNSRTAIHVRRRVRASPASLKLPEMASSLLTAPSPSSGASSDSPEGSHANGGQSRGGSRVLPSSHVRSTVAAVVSFYAVPLPQGADLAGVVQQLYAKDATFTDPLVDVSGSSRIAAQFHWLSLLLRRAAVELHSYRVMSNGRGISMDTTMTFVPRILPSIFALSLRVSTELLLDDVGKVTSSHVALRPPPSHDGKNDVRNMKDPS